MRPRNFLFAISIGALFLGGCGKVVEQKDCAQQIDSMSNSGEAEIDSLGMRVRNLTAIDAEGKATIKSLRDSLQQEIDKKVGPDGLDRNVFHEPPIKF